MSHIILDIRTAAEQLRIGSRLLESLRLAIRGIRKTKLAGTGISARHPGVEKQAQADKARHDGEASAAIMPTQFIR